MPTMQNVILKDRQATPVSHTFNPRDLRDGVGHLAKPNADGTSVGESKVRISSRPKGGNKWETTYETVFPKVVSEMVNGVAVPRVIGTSVIRTVVEWSPEHTETERDNAMGMHQSGLDKTGQPLLYPILVQRQGIFG